MFALWNQESVFSCGFCSGTELCGVFRSLPNRWCLQHVFEALLSQVQKIKKRDEVGCGWSCQHHSTRQVVGLALLSGITDVRFLLAGHTWFKTQIFVNILFLPWERKEDKNLSTMPFLHWSSDNLVDLTKPNPLFRIKVSGRLVRPWFLFFFEGEGMQQRQKKSL